MEASSTQKGFKVISFVPEQKYCIKSIGKIEKQASPELSESHRMIQCKPSLTTVMYDLTAGIFSRHKEKKKENFLFAIFYHK